MAKKILVVDDEPDVLKYATLRLRRKGYKIFTAKDGVEALRLAKATKPDLILLDIVLPRLDGYEVFERIKSDEELATIPVVFATADASIKIAERTKTLRANGFLLKPYESEEFYAAVEKHIAASQVIQHRNPKGLNQRQKQGHSVRG